MNSVWVLGDQLNRRIGALASADPNRDRILMVESTAMLRARPYHRQRLHLVLTAMRRFAGELRTLGFEVDYQRADTLAAGYAAHVRKHHPTGVIATEPNGRGVRSCLQELDVQLVRSNQFLTHPAEFADWASDAERLRMEDFYRWQRRRLGYLMEDDQPAGGRWNFDHDNREPPPANDPGWPLPVNSTLDDIDRAVLDDLPDTATGQAPTGIWATSRRAALARLRHFVSKVLPAFGPHEDAMLSGNWHLAHSLLSPYLNLGLLLPDEVCEAAVAAWHDGHAPINSVEGFIRQIIGWREFVWGTYWLWPDQLQANTLDNRRQLPPAFTGEARTDMRCLQHTLDDLDARGYVHHIQRLMVLANFSNLYGSHPATVRKWMRARYIDGADWVMGPNVHGMAMSADGGRMATKPYVSGGAYIKRMSNYCADCRFNPSKRHGDTACPLTSLYWDFMARNRTHLGNNQRMARQYHTLDKLTDVEATRERAAEVIQSLRDGQL